MTFNTIMVQLDLDRQATPRLKFAWDLARRFEADMIAFAAAEAVPVGPIGEHTVGAGVVLHQQSQHIDGRLKALELEFQAVTNDDQRASWRGRVGNPTTLLALHARAADLIVAGRPEHRPSRSRGTIDPGALILSAGRPVLLHAEGLAPVRLETVVIAWKDTREAHRAVVDAIPFLTQAKDVLVVAVGDGDPAGARAGVADVLRFLMRHGVSARSELVHVGGWQAADVVAELALETGANLVVAGGYGHSRLREWALGGVTRSLLGEIELHRFFSN
ncbi:universal stress protein [Mesorhizobium sp. BAC0120]|uniref:universal stress protein n=1 Tax=Mesorhizobium sp. BAC0120 TaxID=3090670 RepID=UPI00298D1511|nr:universal stress protein [Mesorhizobium sp. BAC0120]MDW6020294.1 universal stress protein [Mesorhizobium sp. BAC0120]